MRFRVIHVCTLLLFFWSARASGQTELIIYDGYTGIFSTHIQNDTVRVITVLPGSPAEKSGIKYRDQIIAINDSAITGTQLNQRFLKDLLHNRAGEPIDLEVRRSGVDSLMHFTLNREPYLHQIVAYEYEYLIDSLEQWDITQINSGGLDSLFVNPLTAKSQIYSVEKGSESEKIGLKPGDRIVSLLEELDKDWNYHISGGVFSTFRADTSFTVLRGDSLIIIELETSLGRSLDGIESQFSHDFSSPCIWLRIKTVNRLSKNRNYLVNLPYMAGTDSANFFLIDPSGNVVEKRTGVLIPTEERDFVYKNWHAASLPLEAGTGQTFYIRWKTATSVGAPLMHVIAEETILQHDRLERMVLFSLLGMMLIIACFFGILFVALRDLQYLYFALYTLFFSCLLFVSEGYLGEFHWKQQFFESIFISRAQAFSLSLVTIFFLLFGNTYLELKQKLSGWYWSVIVVLGLIGLRILIMLLGTILGFEMGGLFEGLVLLIWAFTVGFVPLFLLIIPTILRIRSGFRPAWYFLVANAVLIPLAIITLNTSLYSFSPYFVHESILFRIFKFSGVYVAAVLQILIFSIGLARKMRQDEEEHRRAREKIIDQLKENEKLKDKVNRELEQKVQERTKEISDQKEEIESQRDEIEAQRDLLFDQKKQIIDSIGYAQRIQAAILPHKSYLDRIMPEYFVLYKPRDIVSGDFYWTKELGSSIVVVAADCTGHGVPGAFMSMLGITLLNELFVEGGDNSPGRIMGDLRTKVKTMLVQEGHITDQKDGMDMAIALIDLKKRELQFAGAYNPLYLIRDGERLSGREPGTDKSLKGNGSWLFELKGDRQPIGVHWEEIEFRNQVVELKEHDSIYIFSDGYVDQYGGKDKKKFKTRKFKELLLSVHSESMETQKQILETTFEEWRGDTEQIDDVCVIGIRI